MLENLGQTRLLTELDKLINLVNSILTVYIWAVVCILLLFLFAIARFYQQKSGRRSFYPLFLVPISLFAIAAVKFAFPVPTIVDGFWGDLMRFIGGITLGGGGFFLLKLMIGGRP